MEKLNRQRIIDLAMEYERRAAVVSSQGDREQLLQIAAQLQQVAAKVPAVENKKGAAKRPIATSAATRH
jgi:hypothetical protein